MKDTDIVDGTITADNVTPSETQISFEVGNVVALKSSPTVWMTATRIYHREKWEDLNGNIYSERTSVSCVWLDKNYNTVKADFDSRMLVKIK